MKSGEDIYFAGMRMGHLRSGSVLCCDCLSDRYKVDKSLLYLGSKMARDENRGECPTAK